MSDLHFFDRTEDYTVIERRLPHWSQAGAVCFVTFRTNDSMPKTVVECWQSERKSWLLKQGIDPGSSNWKTSLTKLPPLAQEEFYRTFSSKWHDELDKCHGACVLRKPTLSQILYDSLLHFDGQRYEMISFVVMPNHVHLLATFPSEEGMLEQCERWKHFTATKINRAIGKSGRFWQQDGFDHLVRSLKQFNHFQRYIRENPIKAGLQTGEYRIYSKDDGDT